MSWNPEHIIELLRECGALALEIQHSAKRSRKSDDTLVTEADIRIEAILTKELKSDPGVFFIGEENAHSHGDGYHTEALGARCYVIDPIDGTMLYANHLPGWGISIGYMIEGRLSEGAIFYPASGELLISSGDEVLYGCRADRTCPAISELRPLKPPVPPNLIVTMNQTLLKTCTFQKGATILSTGSCVSSILYLARGGICAYFTQARLWDIAGGCALLFKLGIEVWSLRSSGSGSRSGSGRQPEHTSFRERYRGFSAEVTHEFWHIPPSDPSVYWQMRRAQVLCSGSETFERIRKTIKSGI
ncbi:MAG: inositol monophosphatase family protein [Salinispira sp.]